MQCKLSWLPTLKAMWSPTGQQVMISTPGQPTKRSGMGAVNDHTGETVVLFKSHKRRREIAALLHALLEKHPRETVYVAWENATTHEDDDVEAVVRSAAGRLVLLYLPTYSPWLNPIRNAVAAFSPGSDPWRTLRESQSPGRGRPGFFARYNRCPERILSIIGAIPKNLSVCT